MVVLGHAIIHDVGLETHIHHAVFLGFQGDHRCGGAVIETKLAVVEHHQVVVGDVGRQGSRLGGLLSVAAQQESHDREK